MKRAGVFKVAVGLTALVTCLGYALIHDKARAEAGEHRKVRFAAILPLSGDAAAVGEAFKNGITLALDKLPKEVRDRIEILYEDDAFSSKNSITALNKLLMTGGVDAMINAGSGTGHALAHVLSEGAGQDAPGAVASHGEGVLAVVGTADAAVVADSAEAGR